jgi:adenylate cyclase
VFALQDEITEAIVASMHPELLQFESERAVRQDPKNLDAWELAQRGWWHYNRYTKEDNAKARSFYEKAVELDPQLAFAFAGLAMTHFHDAFYRWTDSPARSVRELVQAAKRSVELDDDDPFALLALSQAYSLTGQPEKNIAAIEFALQLNPSSSMGSYYLGAALAGTGRPDDAVVSIEKAIRLSPQDPWMWMFYTIMGTAHFAAERYEEAVDWAHRGLQRRPDWPVALGVLAVSYAHLGQIDEARSALEDRLRVQPSFSLAGTEELFSRMGMHPDFAERYLDGLRKAGMQE